MIKTIMLKGKDIWDYPSDHSRDYSLYFDFKKKEIWYTKGTDTYKSPCALNKMDFIKYLFKLKSYFNPFVVLYYKLWILFKFKRYTIYQQSPVWTPESLQIKRKQTSYYCSGYFWTFLGAAHRKKRLLKQQLSTWATRDDGETPFWKINPSGIKCPAPTWFKKYGFEPFDNDSSYWFIRPIRACPNKQSR